MEFGVIAVQWASSFWIRMWNTRSAEERTIHLKVKTEISTVEIFKNIL